MGVRVFGATGRLNYLARPTSGARIVRFGVDTSAMGSDKSKTFKGEGRLN
jgi:hypothetical protein